MLNLCINARDAMPDGGRIAIETANRWFDERTAKTQDISEGQYLSLCVTDTGTGMPPDVIARVFEPFFTTKPIGEGTGLDLSMIYWFAQESGGQVRVYSESDKARPSALICRVTTGGRRRRRERYANRHAAFAAGETVLIVDDEPTVRMLFAVVRRPQPLRRQANLTM